MSVTVLVEMTVNPSDIDAFCTLCEEFVRHTRLRPGNLGAQLQQDLEDQGRFCMFEQWRTRAEYDGFNAWRHDRGDFAGLEALFAAPPTRRFWEHVSL